LIVTPTSIQNAKQTSSRTLAPNNEHVNIGGSIVTPTGTTNSLDTSFFFSNFLLYVDKGSDLIV
jgi:hypothetical protein